MRVILPRMRLRRAVTLVEVLVALIVFSIGALGSAAALCVSARAASRAAARRESLAALEATADSLRAQPCAAMVNGERTADQVSVRWSVAPSDSVVGIVISATLRGVPAVLRTEVSCG